jgi:O-antigen/teichoic acid export membrane protein
MGKDAFSLGITRVLILLVSVISLPLLIRLLGEKSYGLHVLIFGAVSLISSFSNLGLGFTAMRGLPSCENKTDREEKFYPQFWAHMVIATCIFCLVHIVGYYSSLGSYLHENDINLWVISLYLLTYPVYIQLDLLFKFSQRINSLNALHLLLPCGYLMAVVGTFYAFERLRINDVLIAHLFSVLLTVYLLRKQSLRLVGFKLNFYSKSGFKVDIRHGLPIILTVILDQVISVSDRYVIAYYLPVENVGYYACAASLTSMLLAIPRVITVMSQPAISKLIDKNSFELASLQVSKTAIYWLMVAIPATIGSFLLGGPFISIYITPQMGVNAGPVLWVLFLGACFFGLFIIYSVVLFAGYRTDKLLQISILASVLNLSLNIVLMNVFADILIAAIVTSFVNCFMFILVYYFSGKILDLYFDVKELSKIITGGAIAGFLVYLTMLGLNLELALGVICLLIAEFIILYVLVLYLFRSELRSINLNIKKYKE